MEVYRHLKCAFQELRWDQVIIKTVTVGLGQSKPGLNGVFLIQKIVTQFFLKIILAKQ